jgi:hypothetical protein
MDMQLVQELACSSKAAASLSSLERRRALPFSGEA